MTLHNPDFAAGAGPESQFARLEQSYSGSHNLFREAAHSFGVDLTLQEDTDWRDLMNGAALVDHLLDVEKLDIVEPIRNIVEGDFRADLRPDYQANFASYVQRQPVKKIEDMLERLHRVNELVIAQREATRASKVIDIRIDEADILAGFLALPANGRNDSSKRDRFNNWLNGWSRAGYLVDSYMDIEADYENGESGVQPTTSARAVIGAAACREGLIAAKRTPPKLIGKCAVTATKYVLLNIKPNMTTQS